MGRRKLHRSKEYLRERNNIAQRKYYQKVKAARAQALECARKRANAPDDATKQNTTSITLIHENGRFRIISANGSNGTVADTLYEISPDHPNCPGPFMFVSVGKITNDNYLEEC